MKIVEPKVEEIKDFEGVDNFYKAVARAARICYANYNRITKLHKEGTYKCTDNWYSQEKIIAVKGKSYEVKKVNNDFVLIGENGHNAHNFNTQCFESWFFKYFENPDDKALVERLIESKHFSPFEHAIISLRPSYIDEFDDVWASGIIEKLYSNKFALQYSKEITVNGRIIVECVDNISELDEFLEFIKSNNLEAKPEINPLSFKSFVVDTSIGCTREMNRHHNNFYICEQSTRYCNFSKDKFGNEVAFNKPYWYDTKNYVYKEWWKGSMKNAEMLYMKSIRNIPDDLKNCSDDEFGMGFPIDEARGILSLDTHTRAIYTATIEE